MTDSHLDALLDELVPAESQAGWGDVLDRSRRAQRRYVALVVAVAVLVLAPATWAAVHAFEGTPAPPSVRRTFEFSNRATAKVARRLHREFPQARVGKAHGVLQVSTRNGPLDLWAAPSTKGGSCFFVDWEASEIKGLLSGTSGCTQRQEPPIIAGTFQGTVWRYSVLFGYARGPEETVRVALDNGRVITLPVVEHSSSPRYGVAPAPTRSSGATRRAESWADGTVERCPRPTAGAREPPPSRPSPVR